MIPEYKTENIRNIAVVGHSSTGKSTLVEDILYFAGAVSKEEKGKVCDFDEEEKLKGFSIHNTLTAFEYEGMKINLLDTPGISDFVGDVFSALRAVEGAIVVVDAEFGIQIETEKTWHYADEYHIPRIVFVNKMDKPQADFFKIIQDLETRFHTPTLPLEIPIGKGEEFEGIIDLIEKKAIYPKGNSNQVEIKAIPDDYKEITEKHYDNLKAVVAETSESLENKYLEGEEFTEEEIKKGLSECIKNFRIVPITCGSVIKNVGVRTLLHLIENEMPAPDYVEEVIGTHPNDTDELIAKKCTPTESFCGFVFKTRIDQYTGRLNYFKVRSGTLKTNDNLIIANKNIKEKVAHLYIGLGEKISEVPRIVAGDIGIIAKTEEIETGDTLTDIHNPLILSPLKVPKPVYFQALNIQDKKNEEKIIEELNKMATEDPTFKIDFDPTTKEQLIKGMGDLHLQLILDKISRKLKVDIPVKKPKVPYKETITAPIEAKYKHKKQTGGRGQFGEVHIKVEPLPRGKGFEFIDKIVGGRIPKQYIPDLQVTLYDGSFHSVDSSELAFKIAAWNALKDALKNAKNALLEPIMKVEIHAESDAMGDIMNDLNSRKGKVLEMHQDENGNQEVASQVIEAYVPLKDMLNYALELKSISKGKASFDMDFDHYDILSGPEAQKIIAMFGEDNG
jgi:elongation factor G